MYLPNEPHTFINIKLTDDGRRLLSLGQLTFNKALLSDREINYNFGINTNYSIGCCNRILAPKDFAPGFSLPVSFDGSDAVPITVGSAKQIITAQTTSTGFFTQTTGGTWTINEEVLFPDKYNGYIGHSQVDSSSVSGSSTIKLIFSGSPMYFPEAGELVYIPWEPSQASTLPMTPKGDILDGAPLNSLWYRVLSGDTGSTTITLDRNTPNNASLSNNLNAYFYPFNGVENLYGTGATNETKVWNMNIVRTNSVEGTNNAIKGYTTYGSIEYNGTKQYLGFGSETKQFGIIHYTNEFTGNTYAEQLVEKSILIDIPNVMWHRKPGIIGEVMSQGMQLNDQSGPTTYDYAASTTYRELRDGLNASDFVVGRVYHKLKLIIITDPELLACLTYKSNRSYTMPRISLGTTSSINSSCSSSPSNPILSTGLIKPKHVYYVTYITDSLTSGSGVTYGHPQALPCQYIERIEGGSPESEPQYLRAYFDNSFFPYLRNQSNMIALSGTGWNANKIQLLVNEVNLELNPDSDINNIPTDKWRLMSSGYTGNGLYTGSTGSATIDPLNISGHQFIVSQEDWNSGSTYVLNNDFHEHNDVSLSGLTFGSESFFFGNIKTAIMATSFKTVMTVLVPDTNYNISKNSSFNESLNVDTYITEIGILNNNNILVAVGKPTYPIKKNDSRFLAFQLEIDF